MRRYPVRACGPKVLCAATRRRPRVRGRTCCGTLREPLALGISFPTVRGTPKTAKSALSTTTSGNTKKFVLLPVGPQTFLCYTTTNFVVPLAGPQTFLWSRWLWCHVPTLNCRKGNSLGRPFWKSDRRRGPVFLRVSVVCRAVSRLAVVLALPRAPRGLGVRRMVHALSLMWSRRHGQRELAPGGVGLGQP